MRDPPESPLHDVVLLASELQELGYSPPFTIHVAPDVWTRITEYLADGARRTGATTVCFRDRIAISSPFGEIVVTSMPPDPPTVH